MKDEKTIKKAVNLGDSQAKNKINKEIDNYSITIINENVKDNNANNDNFKYNNIPKTESENNKFCVDLVNFTDENYNFDKQESFYGLNAELRNLWQRNNINFKPEKNFYNPFAGRIYI